MHLFLINSLINYYFGQILFLKIKKKLFNIEFSNIEIWFTDENYKPQRIKDKTSNTLVIE